MFEYYNSVWAPVYEGEPAAEGQPAEGGAPADGKESSGEPASKAFSQEDVNKMLAAERRKHQQTAEKAIEEAQALRTKAQLTAQERGELDERLEILKGELLTKEQQAKRQAQKLRDKHKEEVSQLASSVETWKSRFTTSTIERSLTDAAAGEQAYSPKQIVAILGPQTRLVEVLDDEGAPSGNLAPKVRFTDKDKDGKPLVLDLSPSDAVKRMKEMDDYLNLFRGEGKSGAGLRSHPGGRKPSLRELASDPAAYREARKKGQIF
jgi:hypothetical protein